jgi:hypothetical protein
MDEMELTNDLTKFPIEAQYLKNGFFWRSKGGTFGSRVSRARVCHKNGYLFEASAAGPKTQNRQLNFVSLFGWEEIRQLFDHFFDIFFSFQ